MKPCVLPLALVNTYFPFISYLSVGFFCISTGSCFLIEIIFCCSSESRQNVFQQLAISVLEPSITAVGILSVRQFVYTYTDLPPVKWACFMELGYSSELQMYETSYTSKTVTYKKAFREYYGLKKAEHSKNYMRSDGFYSSLGSTC